MIDRFDSDAMNLMNILREKVERGESRQVRASEIAAEFNLNIIETSNLLNHLCRQGVLTQQPTAEGYVYIIPAQVA